jgi:hypothetical protein
VSRGRGWLWLTVPLAALLALVSVAGLTQPDLYRGPPAWTLQAVAQDLADLVLVLPVLLAGAWLAARGSWRGWLIWLGSLSYLVYTFAIYAFAVAHNAYFLAYTAILGLSFWAFVGAAVATDWNALARRIGPANPARRWVALYLAVPALLFYGLWLADELPAALAGREPASLAGLGLPTNPVHVLDLAVLLPAMIGAGILLWRRREPAYGLAAVLLVNGLFQNLAIAGMMVLALRAGLPAPTPMIGVMLVLATLNLALQAWFLRGPPRAA